MFRSTAAAGACLRAIAQLVSPGICPVCRAKPVRSHFYACSECSEALRALPHPRCTACGGSKDGILDECSECLRHPKRPWETALSVFPFQGLPRELVHRFKYQNETWLAPLLARLMAETVQSSAIEQVGAVIPVPLHGLKLMKRGYNQSALLAEEIGRLLDVPVCSALRRHGRRPSQTRLDYRRRQQNAKNTFSYRKRVAVAGRHLLLVDDVFTTGATLAAATSALNEGAPAKTTVLTLARG